MRLSIVENPHDLTREVLTGLPEILDNLDTLELYEGQKEALEHVLTQPSERWRSALKMILREYPPVYYDLLPDFYAPLTWADPDRSVHSFRQVVVDKIVAGLGGMQEEKPRHVEEWPPHLKGTEDVVSRDEYWLLSKAPYIHHELKGNQYAVCLRKTTWLGGERKVTSGHNVDCQPLRPGDSYATVVLVNLDRLL